MKNLQTYMQTAEEADPELQQLEQQLKSLRDRKSRMNDQMTRQIENLQMQKDQRRQALGRNTKQL